MKNGSLIHVARTLDGSGTQQEMEPRQRTKTPWIRWALFGMTLAVITYLGVLTWEKTERAKAHRLFAEALKKDPSIVHKQPTQVTPQVQATIKPIQRATNLRAIPSIDGKSVVAPFTVQDPPQE